MKRISTILILVALVVSTLIALTPSPASAQVCPENQPVCFVVRDRLGPLLCQLDNVFGCNGLIRFFFFPDPNPNCNDALRYADTPPTTERGLRWAEYAINCLINQQRTNMGRVALQIDDRLMMAARTHAQDIVVHNATDPHRGSDGSSIGARVARAGYTARSWAENAFALRGRDGTLTYFDENDNVQTCIGPNGRPDTVPRDAVTGWMCSPGHRENILNGVFRHTGVGAVFGSYRAGRSDSREAGEPYPPVTYIQTFAQPA